MNELLKLDIRLKLDLKENRLLLVVLIKSEYSCLVNADEGFKT